MKYRHAATTVDVALNARSSYLQLLTPLSMELRGRVVQSLRKELDDLNISADDIGAVSQVGT